jgi:3-deoxy-D-manno-octulosonic-acid transferase
MRRGVYSLLLAALAPLAWTVLGYRARRSKMRWDVLGTERFGGRVDAGYFYQALRRTVWVHAVSVGETRAAQPLIQALLAAGYQVLLTHMTPTGRATGAELYAKAVADGRLRQCWFPYDFSWVWRRFLRAYRPSCVVLIEREVWPNMIATCKQAAIPVVLVSARLSAGGKRRAQRLGRVLHEAYASLTAVMAQSEDDAIRLAALGVRRPEISGNLKFDVQIDAARIAAGRAWRTRLGRPVIVLASTREGEDEAFARAWLDATATAGIRALLVWVPRHPQRFDEVAATLRAHGFQVQRRHVAPRIMPAPTTEVYLGDTLGEMAFYLGAADVTLMGGSFAGFGSQNFLEPCAAGSPVIIGPSIYNFQDAAADALTHGVIEQVASPADALTLALQRVDAGQAWREAWQIRVHGWLSQHQGATQRIMAVLKRIVAGPR